MNDENVVEGEEAGSWRRTGLDLDAKMLQYVEALWIYHSDQRVRHLNHISVDESAINFCRTRLLAG